MRKHPRVPRTKHDEAKIGAHANSCAFIISPKHLANTKLIAVRRPADKDMRTIGTLIFACKDADRGEISSIRSLGRELKSSISARGAIPYFFGIS